MNKTLNIVLKNNLDELEQLIETIDENASQAGFSPSAIFEINLVLDEAVSNIIRHGYKDADEHLLELKLEFDGNIFSAEISDDGIEFNPLESTKDVRSLPIEERGIGGMGIHIIKEYMDTVEYERHNNKNILKIKKVFNDISNIKNN